MKTERKPTTTIALLCAAALTLSAPADEGTDLVVAWYQEVNAPGGILDPELTTATANDLVLRGITSDDPRDIARTVFGMGLHATGLAMHERVVSRSFSRIPGLKDFLIDYWNATLRDSPGSYADPAMVGWHAPLILAAHFPRDEDVHRVVWDYHAHRGHAFTTLMSLNVGRYNTPEANRMRMDALASSDSMTYAAGALGIEMAKPPGGVDALLAALRDNPLGASMPVTKKALAAYGPEAVPKLLEWSERGDLSDAAKRAISATVDRTKLFPSVDQ